MRRLVAPLLAVALLFAPTAAAAQWAATANGQAAITSSRMTNATAFVASCASATSILLTWTGSPDEFVEGYQIFRIRAGVPAVEIRLPRAQSSYVDTPPEAKGQDDFTYSYTIRSGSTQHLWTTSTLAASRTVRMTKSGCF